MFFLSMYSCFPDIGYSTPHSVVYILDKVIHLQNPRAQSSSLGIFVMSQYSGPVKKGHKRTVQTHSVR